jgi:hypothetical protein
MWFQDLWTYDFRRTEDVHHPLRHTNGRDLVLCLQHRRGLAAHRREMHQTASVAEWYKEHGKHAVYANPRKHVPLGAMAQPIALTIPRDGVLVSVRP